MSQPDAPSPLCLSVLRDERGLIASLTDFRRTAKLEHVELAPAQCRDLQREAQDLIAQGSDVGAARLCHYGSRLFAALLPPSIGNFLRESPARTLMLQLEPELTWVPWELLFDGESFLGEKLCLTRQLVSEGPAPAAHRTIGERGPLRVLVLAGSATRDPSEGAAHGLVARLRLVEGVAVSSANTLDLRRADLLALMQASDLVHYIAPVDEQAPCGGCDHWWHDAEPLGLGAIAALPVSPQLLISHHVAKARCASAAAAQRELAAAACRAGLRMLTCDDTPAGDTGLEWLLGVYQRLVQGLSAAEAVRAARAQLHRQGGISCVAALRPELYGDGDRVVFSHERHPRIDDNLRQVTIMSFDLVESTRLLRVLGAEKYSDMLAEYQRRCARILTGCGGAPDDFQGDDGAMCYFGFPIAQEDAATQAVRAGLLLIEAVQALGLSVRIGVCTGQVVVRDGQPVGAAIHLAARLQAIAAPATLVVGESTRRLVKDRYRFLELGQVKHLKGFDRVETLYRAVADRHTDQRSDGVAEPGAPPLVPLVGRRRELQALNEFWTMARAGRLQLVRIVGDAGIGKSRVVREFKRALGADGYEVFECRCAADHAASAFHPLIESLRSELRLASSDSEQVTLERLQQFAARADGFDDDAVGLLADLLSVPLPSQPRTSAYTAERRRQLTLDLLVRMAQRRMRGLAACLIVEDVHWVDPSTAEFLNRLAREARSLPLLLLTTERSDAEPSWHPRIAVHEVRLHGLTPEQSRTLVLGTCGTERLPSEVVHRIAAHADGVPLFIEESTRMAVELGAADATTGEAAALSVPATILDLLTARLDRLGGAKQIAQVGGTIGREFPLALLCSVLADPGSPFGALDPQPQLAALIRSGLLVARAEAEDTRYAFKHALMRDAAYRSLLERDRKRLHRVIAHVIGEQFRDLAERQPELVAFHLTEAGLDAQAVRSWESAARQAASRSANSEAISHATWALTVLKRGSADGERDRAELRLQLLLATRLIAIDGYGAERVERVYARAMELANALGDDAAQMKVLLGLEGYHFMRADFAQAQAYAAEAAARARRSEAPINAIQAQWALANILMHQGEMDTAVRRMDTCRAEYDRLEHRPAAVQDPGVMCLAYSAWSMWQLGFPDQALERVDAVVARAERLGHKFSVGVAHGFRAAVLHFRGEDQAARESAERAILTCEEGGFAVWLAHAGVIHGRVVAALGDTAAGIDEMQHAYERWTATGAVVTTPFYLALRAEGLALGGRREEALALLEEALAIVERTGERYYEAEVRRLTGRLVLESAERAGLDRTAEAQTWLREALECARARRLMSLALRSAINLADLWLVQQRPA
ncbi:MAG TPA: AAA family ATPase, partial [Burkholderiaceae bacterium]|nr:AAA family ATPase [Burkholderiaceae bacterium]